MFFWKQSWCRNRANEHRSGYPAEFADIKLYLDYHPHAILVMGKDGTILRVNKMFERMLGYELPEVVNHSIFDAPFIPKDELTNLMDNRNEIITGGPTMAVNIRRITKCGKQLKFIATVYPLIKDTSGNETFVIEYRDISWLEMEELSC